MRTPRVARGDHERLRAELYRSTRPATAVTTHRLGSHDTIGARFDDEPPNERPRQEIHALRRPECAPREVRRVLRAHRTYRTARIVAAAHGAAAIRHRVLRRRLTPHRDPRGV